MDTQQQLSDVDRSMVEAVAQGRPGERARAALLRIGQNMQDQGNIYTALYMYHKLLEDYPATTTSRAAMNALVDLAEYSEERGMIHLATVLFNEIDKLDQEEAG